MHARSTYRARILCHLKRIEGTATARDIAAAIDVPCKPVQDALNALHSMEQVARTGRKFSSRWSVRQPEAPSMGWQALSAAWCGRRL